MRSDTAVRLRDAAVRTVGEATGREVLVNPFFNVGILLDGWTPTEKMLTLIEGFEQALYPAVKALLKARRGDIVMDREDITYGHLPYYFTGHWANRQNIKHGERRYVFSIANTGALRAAAGLSGGGPRNRDYIAFPNEKFLDLDWDQQQSLVDITLGNSWATLQAAIKPSAHDFGVVLPDLRALLALLAECGNVRTFIKIVFEKAQPKNTTASIGRSTASFLPWCFLVYLRREKVLLLPLRSYYVDLVGNAQARFFTASLLSEPHQVALEQLWSVTHHYQQNNRTRMARIAQTLLLSADIDVLGDIHPFAFKTVCDNILEELSASPTYRDKVRDLAHLIHRTRTDKQYCPTGTTMPMPPPCWLDRVSDDICQA